MAFQITLQTFRAGRGVIDSLTAGPDQFTLCSDNITLTATVVGNLNGHTIEWEQITGTPVTLGTPNDFSTEFTQLEGSTKVFRFYIDKGKSYEQFDDVVVYNKAVDVIATYPSEMQLTRGLDAPAVDCNTFTFSDGLIVPEVSYLFEGIGPSYLTPITVTWGEITDPVKQPYIIGNDLYISYIPTSLIEFKGELVEGVPRDTSIQNFKPVGTGPDFTLEPGIEGDALTLSGLNSCFVEDLFGEITTHVTISLWVKHNRIGTLMTIASIIDADTFSLGDSRISLQIQNGQILLNLENGGISESHNSGAFLIPDDGEFHHILASVGSSINLYIDNFEIIDAVPTVDTEFYFSKIVLGDISPTITSPLLGAIENFRFYNTNLNLNIDRYSLFEEFIEDKMSESYLVDTYLTGETRELKGAIPYSSAMFNAGAISTWLNNATSGTIITDIFGSSDGVISNGPNLTDSKLIHNAGQSIKFDGVGQYVQVANDYPFIHNTGIFSVETWINIQDLDHLGTQNIMGTNSAGTGFGWNLEYTNSGLTKELIFTHKNSIHVPIIADVSTLGLEPVHIVVTGSGTSVNLYLNGKFHSSQAISILSTGAACGFFSYGNTYDCVAEEYPTSQYFEGNIAEVSIYSVELTSNLILEHYRSSKYNILGKYSINTRYSIAYTQLERLSCNVDYSDLIIENPVTFFALDGPVSTTISSNYKLVRFSNIRRSDQDTVYTNTATAGNVTRYNNISRADMDVVMTYPAVNSKLERFNSTST